MDDQVWIPGQESALKRLLTALGIGEADQAEWQAPHNESRGRMLTKPVWVNRAMRRQSGIRGRLGTGALAPTVGRPGGPFRVYAIDNGVVTSLGEYLEEYDDD
jgi:hypothetical protein